MIETRTLNPHLRGTVLAVLAAFLTGCSSSGCTSQHEYPPEMPFEPRADRLVLRVPTLEPTAPGSPEKWDEELAGLDALGGKTLLPEAIPVEARASLDAFLANTFGTPGEPKIAGDADVNAAAGRLGLSENQLKLGSKLYAGKCVQCHGIAGDGRGPTGQWINPHPRDFRRGAFKFVNTSDGAKPRRSDLLRTIANGLKGTAMPGFAMLPEPERDALAVYATYLSIRGEVEYRTLAALAAELEGEEGTNGDLEAFASAKLKAILKDWERAAAALDLPADPMPDDEATKQSAGYLDSVRRGYELFAAPGSASCIACHKDFGREATFRFDAWGTIVRPADLTSTTLKASQSPDAVFARVRHGIAPSSMPAHPSLSDGQVWDLVHFVRAVPYPRELPADVRRAIYPE